jgi:translation initiation factor IF-2
VEKEKLLAKLKKMGVKVKEEELEEQGTPWGATERVVQDDEGAEFIEKRIKPTVIRRRAKAVEEPEEAPEVVQQEVQEAAQEGAPEVLEEGRPAVAPPAEEMEGEIREEIAGEAREKVVEEPPEEVMPAPQEAARPEEVKEVEEEKAKVKKKKAKVAEEAPEERPPKKRILKRRIVGEAELETEKRYPRVPREQVAKPGKLAKRKVELAFPKKTVITTPKSIKRVIRVAEVIVISELAKRMGVKANEVIKKLMELGTVVTINQTIDAELASVVASEFEYEVEKISLEREDLLEKKADSC